MPAILKGWFERVYAYGLAYGVGQHEGTPWGDRYGEGKFMGRRAMLSITVGWSVATLYRTLNGAMEDLLFPFSMECFGIPHGRIATFVVYQADRLTPEQYDVVAHDYQQRLEHLFDESRFPTVVRMADTTTSNKS